MKAEQLDLETFDEHRARRYRMVARTIVDPKKAKLFNDVAKRLETRLSDYRQWQKQHSLRAYGASEPASKTATVHHIDWCSSYR